MTVMVYQHVAGHVIEDVQRCASCGAVLIDHRPAGVRIGPGGYFFPPGTPYRLVRAEEIGVVLLWPPLAKYNRFHQYRVTHCYGKLEVVGDDRAA